ncbi:Uncharacterised protein [uncultured archaeon]|nr:Uncharacterised protein [uncultured archaeon]
MNAQGQTQIVLIFVAIADEQSISGKAEGERCQKLCLGAYLQTYSVLGTIFDDILDDLFSLVDLHGKDRLVGALVCELVNCNEESSRDLIDPVFKHLRKAQKHREFQIF